MSELNSVLLVIPPIRCDQAKRGEVFVSRGHRCIYCAGMGYTSPEQIGHDEWKDNTCAVCKGSGKLTAKIVIGWNPEKSE